MENASTAAPIEEGLFTWPAEEPALLGSQCPDCETVSFPQSNVCGNPGCNHEEPPDEITLSRTGTLYSYTIHHTPLKEPFEFHSPPFGVGTVELPEGINVVSKLSTSDDNALEIGMPVELSVETLYEEGDTTYVTYCFGPEGDA